MSICTHTHLILRSGTTCRYELAGDRPFVTLTEGDDERHTITLTLRDLDALDALIAALSQGRRSLAPAAKGEAA